MQQPKSFTVMLTTQCMISTLLLLFSSCALPGHAAAGADDGALPCLKELLPCTAYLSSAEPPPPPACCHPIEHAMESEVQCLCRLFGDETLLRSFNVTQEQILQLPGRCGLPAATPDLCKGNAAAAGSSSSPAPAAANATPPSSPKGNNSSNSVGLRSSIGYVIASVFFAGMFSIIALF